MLPVYEIKVSWLRSAVRLALRHVPSDNSQSNFKRYHCLLIAAILIYNIADDFFDYC